MAQQHPFAVWTAAYDNYRRGANLHEAVLNHESVASLHKILSYQVDDAVYAFPLVIPDVQIPYNGTKTLLLTCTVNDSCYAFDALAKTQSNASPIWVRHLANASAGILPVKASDVQKPGTNDFQNNIGVVGTPVVDVARGRMFVVARTTENGRYLTRLHSIFVATGKVERSVIVQGDVDGDGLDSVNHRVTFNSRFQNQRPALLLAGGVIYVAFGSHTDLLPSHGWIFSFRAADLNPMGVWCSTPDGALGSVWMSGAGLIESSAGHIVVGTANGDFGGRNFGESIVKLDPSLRVKAAFNSPEGDSDNGMDHDFASSGLIRFGGLLIGGGKSGRIYGVDENTLGFAFHFTATAGPLFGAPVLWNRTSESPLLFVWSNQDVLRSYAFDSASRRFMPASTGAIPAAIFHGPVLAFSALGDDSSTAIVWANLPLAGADGHDRGSLVAFDALTLAVLWTEFPLETGAQSEQALSPLAKFVPPVISNGRVFRVGAASIDVFGLN